MCQRDVVEARCVRLVLVDAQIAEMLMSWCLYINSPHLPHASKRGGDAARVCLRETKAKHLDGLEGVCERGDDDESSESTHLTKLPRQHFIDPRL